MRLPSSDEQVKFAAHIKPMFRTRDKLSMRLKFDLGSYNDVSARADTILERLRNDTSHRDAAWALFDERLTELAGFSEQLAAGDTRGLGLDEVHTCIQALSASLKPHLRSPHPAAGRPST